MAVAALDTSALMMPIELGVRVFDELDRLLGAPELVVPAPVVDELAALAEGSGTAARAARVGADLATARCRRVETRAATADDALVELARDGRVDYVVTNDRGLRDRVLAAGVAVAGARGRNALAVSRP